MGGCLSRYTTRRFHDLCLALTSTLCKTMESIIANYMSKWLEDNEILSSWQAGFPKGRCNTDQCLRLSQVIMDGFQSKQRLRSVTAFFDFSKAYDQAWRANLLQKMLNSGAPLRFVEWVKTWFTNRTARVRVNGTLPYVQRRPPTRFGAITSPL